MPDPSVPTMPPPQELGKGVLLQDAESLHFGALVGGLYTWLLGRGQVVESARFLVTQRLARGDSPSPLLGQVL